MVIFGIIKILLQALIHEFQTNTLSLLVLIWIALGTYSLIMIIKEFN